jgi:cytoskeletal protein CcmA (bactofilin family)
MDSRTAPAPQDNRNQVASNGKLLTILGTSARIEGKFQIAESIEVQCEITGELNVGGTLVIGDRGRVAADVSTVNAVIIGSYTGNLKASGSVEIAASGRVSGTVESNELVIAKGAVFTGSVAHIEKEAPKTRAASQQRQVELAAAVGLPERAQPTAQPTAQPAAQPTFPSDVETAIPVARLIELDAGDSNPGVKDNPSRSSSFRVS